MSKECLFCGIIAGTIPAAVVLETPDVVGFLDTRPVFKGHVLLVPRIHVETLPDLPETLLVPLFSTAQRVADALTSGLGAQGTFVAMNNVVSQSVPTCTCTSCRAPRATGSGASSGLGRSTPTTRPSSTPHVSRRHWHDPHPRRSHGEGLHRAGGRGHAVRLQRLENDPVCGGYAFLAGDTAAIIGFHGGYQTSMLGHTGESIETLIAGWLVEQRHHHGVEAPVAAHATHPCPICGALTAHTDRYPHSVCVDCQSRATDREGRRIVGYNEGFSGGLIVFYAESPAGPQSEIAGEVLETRRCWIDGIECTIGEARFGGVVIERQ
ncbi:HIT family protein [Aeromicrobium sp. UC242_57]|uniref:HIT family protein n=1 Tax=Aeromicrobium sp. UC242_57 TaxID=3374624 RepID=UPI00379A9F50